MLGRFNGFLKSVILRVSEARDLGEFDRFAFYEHMKQYTAAPPDVLRIDEKNRAEYSVPNVTGVVITTNHKSDGIYLPADDRRHFVAWTDLDKSAFTPEYWFTLWDWYDNGGFQIVAGYLLRLDLAAFNPKQPPPQTEAFFEIVNSSRAPEDAELADALEALGRPDTVTVSQIIEITDQSTLAEFLRDRRNSRRIPHRLEASEYVPVRNPDAKDGLWKISGRRQVIYAKDSLAQSERLAAARNVR